MKDIHTDIIDNFFFRIKGDKVLSTPRVNWLEKPELCKHEECETTQWKWIDIYKGAQPSKPLELVRFQRLIVCSYSTRSNQRNKGRTGKF